MGSHIGFVPLNQTVRARRHPGMIQGKVVGNKVQHEAKAKMIQSGSELHEIPFASQRGVNDIRVDGIRRASNIAFGPSWQGFVILSAQIDVKQSLASGTRTALPYSHEPDQVKSAAVNNLPLFVRDSRQSQLATVPF